MNFVDDLIEKKLVQRRNHDILPISLYRYTRKVFYKSLFKTDERLRKVRGMGIHQNGTVVIKPFYKVYNYTENDAGQDWNRSDLVLAVRKMNGFMGCVSRVGNQVVYSTTGTFDSDYVQLAKQYIENQIDVDKHLENNETWIFEICATEDPHIIKEKTGVYLIGVMPSGHHIDNDYRYPWHFKNTLMTSENALLYHEELLEFATHIGSNTYDMTIMTFGDLLDKMSDIKHEGFMVYNLSNGRRVNEECVKIKSPYYLSTKFLARYNLREDVNWDFLKKRIDEEFYGILDHIKNNPDKFFSLDEQGRITYVEEYFKQF